MSLEEKIREDSESPYVSKFLEFFEANYKRELERLVENYPDKRSLDIDFTLLERFDIELADAVLDRPELLLEAAKDAVEQIEVPALEIEKFSPHVRFFNLPKEHEPLVRDISAKQLGKLIAVEGIVRQITTVMPKLQLAVWKCKHCGNTYKKKQDNQQLQMPSFCECRHRDFELVPEQSEFIDSQRIEIQEPLEKLKGNEQASTLNIYIADDLVNRISAGDKTRFVGILRLALPDKKKTIYGRYLEALHLEETQREFESVEVTPEEENEIRALAENPEIYEKLTKSIAPAIYGHETVKESIILQLFGGVKKHLPGNQTIRGNVHVLLVGDPGTGKSQILQSSHNIAPRSIYTAGKTTSGVGLCVAPDSLILNDNGFKPIKDFVEENFCEENSVEEIPNAWANNFSGKSHCLGSKLKLEKEDIYKIWKIKAPEEMIRIKTRLGKEIELTPNTSLVRLKDNKIEWVKSEDLGKGDFVACPRKLPEGNKKNIPSISLLANDKNILVKDNVAELLKEITDILVKDYGSLQKIAKKIGKSRDTIYAIRNKRHYHAISLKNLIELSQEAGFSLEDISKQISEVFVNHGKPMKIPIYLDNEKLAYLAGLALGDGSLWEKGNGTSTIRIFSATEQLLQEIDAISLELFGLLPEKINDGFRVPARRISYRVVCELLKAFGLNRDKTRIRISHLATEMPNNILAKLLQGLFDTDGWVVIGKNYSSSVGITTISKGLAKSLHLALLKFGIQSKLRKRKKAEKIAVEKKISVTSSHDQYYTEIRGKKNIETFEKQIGFNLVEKKKKLRELISKAPEENTNIDIIPSIHQLLKNQNAEWIYSSGRLNISRKKLQKFVRKKSFNNLLLKQLAKSDILWEEVSEKECFKPCYEFVYDFSVKKDHNFIANGIFVHNTASAVKDDFGEGGWTLKAGALVLSSGGICMVDELDKMDAEDRSAMHEAMEQGMISVAKAGIVTRFKSDTSILAAANPKMSRFEQYTPFIEQINLPASLISRFDLFFMIKDVLDRTKDEAITAHILKTHKSGELISQYKKKGNALKKEDQEDIELISTPPVDPELLGKYISFTRQNIFPVMSKEAIQAIGDFYIGLRDIGRKEGSYAATHRQLEGLVRLAEASARIRLSDTAEKEDAERAIKLVKASLSDVVTDPETGKIDYDIIMTGQTHTQITNMRKILSILREKAAEMDNVPLQDVLNEAVSEGIDKERARDLIQKLEKNGELYRPRHNFLKPTRKD